CGHRHERADGCWDGLVPVPVAGLVPGKKTPALQLEPHKLFKSQSANNGNRSPMLPQLLSRTKFCHPHG
ncbi:hypothetical protein P7K49_032583, partial [Saguinus oedipus]